MPDHTGGMGGPSAGTDTAPLIDARQQAHADAVLQRVLAPFLEPLTVTNQELGQVRAERDAAIVERDILLTQLAARQEGAGSSAKGTEGILVSLPTMSDPEGAEQAEQASEKQHWPWWMRSLAGKQHEGESNERRKDDTPTYDGSGASCARVMTY